MDTFKILDRIEEILEKEKDALKEEDPKTSKGVVMELVYLVLQFILNLIKAPFRFVAGYVKKEIVSAVKKDAGLMAVISAMIIVLFVFFLIFWFSVSVAVGAYFYENGNTLFVSILYSIAFQILSLLFVALVAYISVRSLKTFKIFRSLKQNK